MKTNIRLRAALALPLGLVACKEEPTGPKETPVYWQDVAPILYERCGQCHTEGGIAPFRLDTYADAAQWAEASANAVAARTMPPWLVTDDGSCGEFRNSKALSDDEIDTIVWWADGGAPEGTPRTDLELPVPDTLADAVEFETPDFLPEIVGDAYAEFDEYRCFVVDLGLDRDVFLTGYDVHPGNPKIVHHVLGMPVDPNATGAGGKRNAEILQALDDESPDRLGWPCFGAAGDGVNVGGIPVSWAPGLGVVHMTEGTGARIRQSDLFVVQVHYNLAAAGSEGMRDKTKLRLQFADKVQYPGMFLLPDPFLDTLYQGKPEELAPGKASVSYTWEIPLGLLFQFLGLNQVELHGVFPHMHEFGRKMKIELVGGDDGDMCVGDVQHWDFDWQLYYFYDQPLSLRPDQTLRVTCEYDTRGATEPVLPGWGTKNEMCLAGLYLVPK